MKNKKILSIILTALLLLSTVSIPVYAEDGPLISVIVNRIFTKLLAGTLIKLTADIAGNTVEWILPDEYVVDAFELGGIPMEYTYEKGSNPDKAILQLHGGAYIMPFNDTYRRNAVHYSEVSGGAAVLSVDYRVAPKNPYPAALEDALAGYNWLLNKGYRPENIIVVGDSAGGGLTIALAMYLRDNNLPMPKALILMAPWVNLDVSSLKNFSSQYVGDDNPRNPYISPLYGTFENLPPILLQVGDDDGLMNSNIDIAKRIGDSGQDITITVYKGVGHVFQLNYPATEQSIESWDEIEAFIRKMF